jgi:hypothetical protein
VSVESSPFEHVEEKNFESNSSSGKRLKSGRRITSHRKKKKKKN